MQSDFCEIETFNNEIKIIHTQIFTAAKTWYGMGDAQCNSARNGVENFEFYPIQFTLLTDR